MVMFMCFAVWCILQATQVRAGEVYPIEEVESLWAPRLYNNYVMNDYLANDPPPSPECMNSNREDNEKDIQWFKTCIVDVYKFEKNQDYDNWDKMGDFTGKIGTNPFKVAAARALAFFRDNNNWSTTKATYKDAQGNCIKLLYITAARYLLVTHILWEQNSENLAPCQERTTGNKEITIPSSVCYPQPYGSATCTSDYDVGLVGPDSGILTEKFNEFFKGNGFGVPSENVFDTNVYAFTLEYAAPIKFTGLSQAFLNDLSNAEQQMTFKMQELVGSFYKVFKYEETFFAALLDTAKTQLGKVKPVVDKLNQWNEKVQGYHRAISLTAGRQNHNDEYQRLVKSISEAGGYSKTNLVTLGNALLYAAEAYHTRGAIRYVVGCIQMKLNAYDPSTLSNMDLWVSLIENWGESIKEYKHSCQGTVKVEACVLKMSKYMWRMVAAMKHLKERIDAHKAQLPQGPDLSGIRMPHSLVFFENPTNPEQIMRNWYKNFKLTGKAEIQTQQLDLSAFFRRFGCAGVVIGKPLAPKCLESINGRVNEYNQWMAEIFIFNYLKKTSGNGK